MAALIRARVQNVLQRETQTSDNTSAVSHNKCCFFFFSCCFVSSRQLTEPGCSSAAGSHSKSFDHSHYRPYQGGGGDSGDALSVTSVSSSGSDLEDVNASFLSDSPEGHERKVRKYDEKKP